MTNDQRMKLQELKQNLEQTIKDGDCHRSPAYWARLRRAELAYEKYAKEVGYDEGTESTASSSL